MFNTIKNVVKSAFSSVKQAGSKALAGVGAIGASLYSTTAEAAVTVDATTGTLTGEIDKGMYISGIPLTIGFIAFTISVVAVIGLIKRAK